MQRKQELFIANGFASWSWTDPSVKVTSTFTAQDNELE